MNTRLRDTFALILTVTVTFISFGLAIPAQAFGHSLTGAVQTAPSLTAGNIIALANVDRAAAGSHQVTEDPLLDQAAQERANDMATKGYFSHIDPSGNAPWVWFKRVGYYYWGAAENLALNFDSAQSVNTAWMNSPSHRQNLLNGSYTRMGVGIAYGTYQGRPATYIVQFFADPYLGKVASR